MIQKINSPTHLIHFFDAFFKKSCVIILDSLPSTLHTHTHVQHFVSMWMAEVKRDFDQLAIPAWYGCKYHCRNKAKAPDSHRVTRGESCPKAKLISLYRYISTWLPLNKCILHLYQSIWQFTFRNFRSIWFLQEGVFSKVFFRWPFFKLLMFSWFLSKIWDFEGKKETHYDLGKLIFYYIILIYTYRNIDIY